MATPTAHIRTRFMILPGWYHRGLKKKAARAEPEHCETHQTARRPMPMHHVRQEKLPFVGSSFEFVGAEQADTGVSVFLYQGKPGSGPGPHRHPYDEIQFIREGRGIWTVNGKTFEGGAGDIFVIKAGEIHSFKVTGDSPLIQLDVHVSPRFIQENL
jgi:quercetin dioxygenase-like cupin family protein